MSSTRLTLTHSANAVDAVRKSRIDYITMLGTTKLSKKASRSFVVVAPVVTASVSALGILIVGVLILITGCGPPI
jgi:hypothetical protein